MGHVKELFMVMIGMIKASVIEGTNNLSNGTLIWYPYFFSAEESDRYLSALINGARWQQESMKMYGKIVPFPRLTAWYADAGVTYSYSGLTHQPEPWTEELLQIKNRIEVVAGNTFNSVLINRYRGGSDSMSWHADDEPELGRNPIIASVNFGATRTFQLRHNTTTERINVELTHGSVLIMAGELQHHWKHQVPKTKREVDERVNLTFRLVNG